MEKACRDILHRIDAGWINRKRKCSCSTVEVLLSVKMPDIFLPEDLVELFKASYGLNLLITCVPDLLTQDSSPVLCGPPGSGSFHRQAKD